MSVAPVCSWPAMSPRPPVAPKATGSCFQMMVMPMAASMPLMTADGTRAAKRPMRSNPKRELQPAGNHHRRQERRETAEVLHFDQHDRRQPGGRAGDRKRRAADERHDQPADDAGDQARHRRHAARHGDAEAERQGHEEDDQAGNGILFGMAEHRGVVMHGRWLLRETRPANREDDRDDVGGGSAALERSAHAS